MRTERRAYRDKSHRERQAIHSHCKAGTRVKAYTSSVCSKPSVSRVLRSFGPQDPIPSNRRAPRSLPWKRRDGWISSLPAWMYWSRDLSRQKNFWAIRSFAIAGSNSVFRKIGFAVAVALQMLLIVFPPPIWSVHPPHVVAPPLRMELTWYGPVKDLPTVMPTSKLTKTPSRNEIRKVVDHRAANAFHPRQTIISEPLHPTHPRQTLLQPTASQEPPKILPQLPNIVRLASSEPTRPKMQLSPEQLAAMRPKSAASLRALDAPAPDVSAAEKVPGTINIPSVAQALAKPILPVSPMSAPRAIQQRNVANSSVPDIAGRTGEINTLIALSTTPAPVAPPPSIPAGNLSARISISPDGQQPGGSAAHTGASAGPAQGGGHGPRRDFHHRR